MIKSLRGRVFAGLTVVIVLTGAIRRRTARPTSAGFGRCTRGCTTMCVKAAPSASYSERVPTGRGADEKRNLPVVEQAYEILLQGARHAAVMDADAMFKRMRDDPVRIVFLSDPVDRRGCRVMAWELASFDQQLCDLAGAAGGLAIDDRGPVELLAELKQAGIARVAACGQIEINDIDRDGRKFRRDEMVRVPVPVETLDRLDVVLIDRTARRSWRACERQG